MSDNKKEIEDKITRLKRQIFILDMKDNWDSVDFMDMNRMKEELRKLEEEVND
jgi:hypothetical protein